MRYFEQHIKNNSEIFNQLPTEFSKYTNRQTLRYCVGAALYMPATRQDIAEEILQKKYIACTSIVIDLEDALGDFQVTDGEQNVLRTLTKLQQSLNQQIFTIEQLPLLFIRVRSVEQLEMISDVIGDLQHLLTGYVLPKFSAKSGLRYLQHIKKLNDDGFTLYAMPILESSAILQLQTRKEELVKIKALLDEYYTFILNVRIGSTDFSGILGVRRSVQHTVYDLVTIRDCLADIFNVFLSSPTSYVVSGSVWEYFGSVAANEGLKREILMDKLNGLIGKTIIHPSHLPIVQAYYAVSHEEYTDATAIITKETGVIGVEKSQYGNKMNEMKPHLEWAERTLQRAKVYGVLQKDITNEQLLQSEVLI